MSGLNARFSVSSAAVVGLLSAALFASPAAAAPEAIMLETIGAVRMAQPDETWSRTAEREAPRAQTQDHQSRDVQEASAR